MIPQLLAKDYPSILNFLYVVGIFWIVITACPVVDMFYGLSKARQLGEKIQSDTFKRTIYKMKDYYFLAVMSLFGDIALSPFTYYLPFPMKIVPICTSIVSMLIVYTEFKSIKEKGDKKVWRQLQNNLKDMTDFYNVLKDKELIDKFSEYVKNREDGV